MSQQNELPQEPLPTEVSPQGLNLLYETLAHSPCAGYVPYLSAQ